MPAVELARLRIQVAGLMQAFDEPALFTRRLDDLLEFYANRAYRRGQIGGRPPIIPYYNVPAPVLRQVEGELRRAAEVDPAAALRLADALWACDHLEPRQLAIRLLGETPLQPAEAILERLGAWASPELEMRLRDELLTTGGARLQREMPDRWLELAGDWLASHRPLFQAMGLRAMLPVVSDARFENLPLVYRLLAPITQDAAVEIQVDLLAVLEVLARRSPVETAYFLRQALAAANQPGVRRVVRRSLPFFTPETQRSLRDALQKPA